jgi:hypothetical protein
MRRDFRFSSAGSVLEAFAAVDGTVVAGLKGNLAGLPALGADSVEHLAGASCVAGLLACIPAITAALRLVLKALFSIELLFPGSEHEFFPTVLANECFVSVHELPRYIIIDFAFWRFVTIALMFRIVKTFFITAPLQFAIRLPFRFFHL